MAIRALVLRTTIVAFSLAALMGVAALVAGGSFGRTEGRILLTTLLVGVVSVLVLCFLTLAGSPVQWVGVAGGVVVVVPLVTALLMIWGTGDEDPPTAVWRTFGVGAVLAATLAQACLLLALARTGRTTVRALLAATLALAGLLACMLVALVLGHEPGGGYARLLGVVAILDVLGTVLVAALSRFAPAARAATTVGVDLPLTLAVRVDALASRTGRTRAEVVGEAVERHLDDVARQAAD